jgi:FkbM family methyltransferase
VTRHFYENGWKGINIEPLPTWLPILNEKRPRDINLQVAAASQGGQIEIYELDDTRLSTSSKDTVNRHLSNLGQDSRKHTVQKITLNSILEDHVAGEIHFLKIDVEGAEEDVIKGIDFTKYRPWIVLVESTLPYTTIESHDLWDHLITGRGYSFVYFDGLNRYYLAEEHNRMKENFRLPPYIGDGFISHGQRVAEDNVFVLKDRIHRMENSLSWKISFPLRWIDRVLR